MLDTAATITIAQIILKGTMAAAGSNSRAISTTFYYRRTTTVAGVDKPSLHTSFATIVGAPFLLAVHQDYGNFTTNIRWLNDRTDPTLVTTMAGAGAVATQRLPMKDTVIMALKAGFRGKQFVSRKFFAGAAEVHTTGDVLTGAGLVLWQNLRDALKANLSDTPGNVWTPCVIQNYVSKRYVTDLSIQPCKITSEYATDCVLNLNISDLDKRKVGVAR